ncbi:lambda exonuclease family protein [Ramlibacter sp. MAHUQ-53]|uniref:lambda exonuclease family protein n=1 Tax=unclassified Ramlibacter TaxID=2617605 RepID=UPI00362AEFA9
MTTTVVQGSPEWFEARLGRVTASRVADVIAKTKTGYSTSRENYMVELALERLTGQRQEFYTNDAMRWGTDTEPLARAAYEAHTGAIVEEVGLIPHPTIEMAGASPDGLVGRDGQIEIKCPNSATHLKTLRSKSPDSKYVTQMQWQLACTGRAWCDFVSFDPRMPAGLQLFVTRIERDPKTIAQLEGEVISFLEEVAATVLQLMTIKEAA